MDPYKKLKIFITFGLIFQFCNCNAGNRATAESIRSVIGGVGDTVKKFAEYDAGKKGLEMIKYKKIYHTVFGRLLRQFNNLAPLSVLGDLIFGSLAGQRYVLITIKFEEFSIYFIIQIRHVSAKPPECPVLASYQMWFLPKNSSKMPKTIVK